MNFTEYQQKAMRTAGTLEFMERIENGILGAGGEAGELIDLWKKYKFQGHPLDRTKMVNEAGDVLWYLACLADGLGTTLEEIAKYNVEKLNRRYPDGFDPDKSINRGE